MVDLWLHDIESLEAVTQDEHTKRICLRMAAMSQEGTNFLLAVEDYVRRTRLFH